MKMYMSEELWEKGKKNIINGTSLLSRGPRVNVDGIAPKYFESAYDGHIVDVDGHDFIDYGMAVGSVILGYNYFDYPMREVIKIGGNHSLLSKYQVALSEKLIENIPSCERMKFLSTGSEATECAIRFARAFNNKPYIIHDHYHGWMSWCAPKDGGIPKSYSTLSIRIEENDVEKFKPFLEDREVSAVIIEPMKAYETTFEERKKFLKELKNICHKNDTLLIFDEIACGYRFGLGGAQKYFGVTPDISAFGKSIGNGYPLSVVCTSEEIANDIEDKIFISSTYGGNNTSLYAGYLTTCEMENKEILEHITDYGKALKEQINNLSKEYLSYTRVKIVGLPQRLAWNISNWDLRSVIMQRFINKHIFFTWEIKNCYSHNFEADIDNTIEAFEKIIKDCKSLKTRKQFRRELKGKPMRPIL